MDSLKAAADGDSFTPILKRWQAAYWRFWNSPAKPEPSDSWPGEEGKMKALVEEAKAEEVKTEENRVTLRTMDALWALQKNRCLVDYWNFHNMPDGQWLRGRSSLHFWTP